MTWAGVCFVVLEVAVGSKLLVLFDEASCEMISRATFLYFVNSIAGEYM